MGVADWEGRYRGGGGRGGLSGSEEAQQEWSIMEERATTTGGELFGGLGRKVRCAGREREEGGGVVRRR